MPAHPKTVQLQTFAGLNNVLRPERTDPKYLKEATNIDIDKSGGIKKRLGYSLVESGDYHSLWSDGSDCLAVKDETLVRINSDLSTDTILTGVTSSLSFDKIGGKVYFTGTSVNGCIEGNSAIPWGIAEPNPKPTLVPTSGGLTKGRYQVALTFVRADGLESGSSLAQFVDLGDNSGILLTNLPNSADPQVTTIRIYVSTPDGEVLYFYRDIPDGTSSTVVSSVTTGVLPLASFNRKPAPQGHLTRVAHGRALVAEENVLWYSDPYSYHWFDKHANYIVFPDRIRGILPVEGGVWIASDKLYYLIGKDITTAKMEMKEPVQMVEGTDVQVPGAYIFIENTPIGYKWLITTDKGIYVCFNDGIALNMTEKNVVFPEADTGTGVFVQRDGINRYLSVIDKQKDSNNTAVGDLVTATIIRNGVALEE